jgi:hypothetical protein
VRYVADGALRERLLSLTDLKYFDAASICTAIENQLLVNNIDYLRCVAQTYDGAAVMSGALGGVQAHFRKKHPEAIYVHCYAHELNLVLCHMCRLVSDMLDNVYNFFNSSLVNHHIFEETQKNLGLQQTELVLYCLNLSTHSVHVNCVP